MIRTDLGIATAYAEAVSKGYTGTRDEFGQMFVDFGKTAEKVTEDKKAVEQMKASVEETKNSVDTTAAEFGQNVADKTEEAKSAITEHANTEKASATAAISEAKDDATGAIASAKDSATSEIAKKGTDTLATIPADYTALSKDVSSLKEDLTYTNTLIKNSIFTTNLFDKITYNSKGYYDLKGKFTYDPVYGSTGFIKVQPAKRFLTNTTNYITYWTKDLEFISGVNNSPLIRTPDNCEYVNVALQENRTDSFFIIYDGYSFYKYTIEDKLQKEIEKGLLVDTNNLFDANKYWDGYFYNTDGTVSPIKDWGSYTIEHVEGREYIKNYVGNVVFFTPSSITLKNYNSYERITPPTGTTLIVFAVKKKFIGNFYIIPYGEEYRYNVKLKTDLWNKKYGALGDSITYGLTANINYGTIISDKLGLIFTNYGISGNRISSTDNDTNSSPMCIRYNNMASNLDIVTIMGGTNDYASQVPIGTNDSEDIKTFKGALNVLCKGITEKYSGKIVGFVTPIQRKTDDRNIKLIEYVNAIKEICAKFSVPVLDLYNGGGITTIFSDNSNDLLSDGLHPNDKGQYVLARKIEGFIKNI